MTVNYCLLHHFFSIQTHPTQKQTNKQKKLNQKLPNKKKKTGPKSVYTLHYGSIITLLVTSEKIKDYEKRHFFTRTRFNIASSGIKVMSKTVLPAKQRCWVAAGTCPMTSRMSSTRVQTRTPGRPICPTSINYIECKIKKWCTYSPQKWFSLVDIVDL